MVEANPANTEQQEQAQAQQTTAAFDYAGHTFRTPDKTLVTVEHVEEFKNSAGCQELLGFITALTNACKTTQMTRIPLTEVSKTMMILDW